MVWSVIYSAINIILEYAKHGTFTLQEIAKDIILGKSAPQLYYCIVLLQLTILTPIIIKFVTHKRLKWFFYSITPLWLAYIYLWNIQTGEMPPLYNVCFPAWIGFYAWGIEERQTDVRKMPWWPIAIAVAAEIGEAFTLLAIGCSPKFACSQIRITPFLLVTVMILRFRNMKKPTANRICYIGDLSYGIFFVHYIFIMLSRPLIARLPYISQSWILQAIICAVISLTLSVATIKIARKIVKKADWLSILGFN